MDKGKNTTSGVSTQRIGARIDAFVKSVTDNRKEYARRWYDNNFFDDGFHYRYISRNTGRVVDLTEKGSVNNPQRAIPKASKQIRAIANTLLQSEYIPVVYPDKPVKFTLEENPQLYQQMMQQSQQDAKKQSHWIQYEWQNQDMQQKLAYMIVLAAKHGASWLKIWPDAEKEKINTTIRDMFDMFFIGTYMSEKHLPFMIEASPETIASIKANPMFDEAQTAKISPDNKYAADEIKEAYMRARHGAYNMVDQAATLILKECFLEEFIDDNNLPIIRAQKDGEKILAGKSKGSEVIRQIFCTADLALYDKYTPLHDYPYIPLQLESGPFYQTPLIERFISQNKSLDTVVSRVEKYTNTMTSGAWLKRKGENFQPTNMAGGVVYEYEVSPPTQLEVSAIPSSVFTYINLLDGFIHEQGLSVVGGKLPKGMKGYQAIESLKATEVANIKMSADQVTKFIKKVSERFLEHADEYFTKPQDVTAMNKGEPSYLSVIGQQAFQKYQELGLSTNGLTPLSKKTSIEINVESGLGYTPEAKKQAALQLDQLMERWAQQGYIPPQAMQAFIKNVLNAYDYGNTQEFMETVNANLGQQVPQTMLDQIKLAVAQVFQDISKGAQGGGGGQPQAQPQGAMPEHPAQAQGQPSSMPNVANMGGGVR